MPQRPVTYTLILFLALLLCPAGLSHLLFPHASLPADINAVTHSPWTLLTHAFMHGSRLHLALNILVITPFALIIANSSRRPLALLIATFVCGTLTGAALFILTAHGTPQTLVGASAGALAIMTLAVARLLNNHFLNSTSLSLPTLALALLIAIVAFALPSLTAAERMAHLGGILAGIGLALLILRGSPRRTPSLSSHKPSAPQHISHRLRRSGFSSLSPDEQDLLRRPR